MMRTVIEKLRGHGNFKLVLAANKASPYERRCEVTAYQYFSFSFGCLDFNFLTYFVPKKLSNWIRDNYGIVLEKDLYAVLDASGYAYGDKWPIRGLQRTCSQISRLSKKGKKYIFLPQMFGPFEKDESRFLIKSYFKSANFIFAREDTSKAYLETIMPNSDNIDIAPDFTNLLEIKFRQRSNKKCIIIPNSNMLSARSGDSEWPVKYLEIFSEMISAALDHGMEVTIINHEDASDEPICKRLSELFSGKVKLKQGLNAKEIKIEIAESNIVVSSRFHGCVSALSQGVMCIGTSWGHKYEELYKDYSVSELLISKPNQHENYKEFFVRMLDKQINIESVISRESSRLKEQSKVVWKKIENLLQD